MQAPLHYTDVVKPRQSRQIQAYNLLIGGASAPCSEWRDCAGK